jgi:predicted glycosyltransferase involved in capsule biosynthesis
MFDHVGGFDESMVGFSSEDADFSLRLVKAGFTLTFTRAVSVYHVNHWWMMGWGGYGSTRDVFRQKHGFWGP